jgi:hypothetical protein
MKPGFDPGFHAYDAYRYKVEDTKIFTTTRPYTELAYLLGSKSEQLIDMMHTQNRSASLNFSFGFRFINAPGYLLRTRIPTIIIFVLHLLISVRTSVTTIHLFLSTTETSLQKTAVYRMTRRWKATGL